MPINFPDWDKDSSKKIKKIIKDVFPLVLACLLIAGIVQSHWFIDQITSLPSWMVALILIGLLSFVFGDRIILWKSFKR